MNWYGVKAIYIHEMERFRRTLFQSLASPIITTSLYFVVLVQQLDQELQR